MEDLQEIINNKDSKQTKAVKEKSVGIFRLYCESKEYVFSEAEKYNDSELSNLLREFYAEVLACSVWLLLLTTFWIGFGFSMILYSGPRHKDTIGWQMSLTIIFLHFQLVYQ